MNILENKLKNRPQRLQHGFRPVYYFSRFVGLWPFTIANDSNGSIKAAHVNLFDRLWFLLSICLYSVALYYTYADMREINHSSVDSYFMDVINYITQIPILLFEASNIVLDMLNRKILVNILNKFIIFDSKVSLDNCSYHVCM